ncbi:MAG: glycosyltransferase family 4 protein [Flavobacteriales bacterium]
MPKILYIAPHLSSFVKNDILILEEENTVLKDIRDWSKKLNTPLLILKQLFFLLKNIRELDRIIISFGGYWSLFPTLLGKIFGVPTYIIINGTDAVAFDEINYGSLRKTPLKQVIYLSYKLASRLLPVSKSLMYTKNSYYGKYELEHGVKAYFNNLKTPYTVIPNGIDFKQWKLDKIVERSPLSFLTVMGKGQEKVKGIELFVELATSFPNCTFSIAGVDSISFSTPDNVHCLGRKTQTELTEIYYQNLFYLQLSNFEGFGVSLCESMYCGCIPIVSKVNALPEIIGNSGFVIERRDVRTAIYVVETAIETVSSGRYSNSSRQRIVENYSIQHRNNEFVELLKIKKKESK